MNLRFILEACIATQPTLPHFLGRIVTLVIPVGIFLIHSYFFVYFI